ncbi:NADH:ubiquinone oxidoreductase subunit NDUFA12 [Sphingomonas sp.]|uniref:NADH:ubiquinone oxidoreductase subunit NDUFA12 n=1 Tax=Sphingomonas sp. TaxID=28214 RepID=UPI00325FD188
MGLFGKFFSPSWWNGATFGTALFSNRHGREVGRDDAGNVYLQHKDDARRRWVIYDGANDGSRVPPGWQAWLKGTIDELPEKDLPPRRPFEQPPLANQTGTFAAYKPGGSLGGQGVRPAATGDYQAWKPE